MLVDKKYCLETWVPALRSGQYSQCMYGLHMYEQFCAVGVLLDTLKSEWEKSPIEPGVWTWADTGFSSIAPSQYLDRDIKILVDDARNMNDAGKSFDEIADYIEESLNGRTA